MGKVKITPITTVKEYLDNSEAVRLQNIGQITYDGQIPDCLKPQDILPEAITFERPNVHWNDIEGLEDAKTTLKETVVLPLKFPRLFTGNRCPWKTILLYGPPGTGKSLIAEGVATHAESALFSLRCNDLASKWPDEAQRILKTLFDRARLSQPAIILLDNVDALVGPPGETESIWTKKTKTEVLMQIDSMWGQELGVVVIGVTSKPWNLDIAIKKRFEERIYIPLPSAEIRRDKFLHCINSTPNELTEEDYDVLVARTQGYSSADVISVVRETMLLPVRKLISGRYFAPIPNTHRTKWTPCSSEDEQAVEKYCLDIEAAEIFEPALKMTDFMEILSGMHPVWDGEEVDIRRYDEWDI